MVRFLACFLFLCVSIQAASAQVRVKDITAITNLEAHQLVGYGLVIGLQGTGDSLRNAPFTEQSLRSMLDKMGVSVRAGQMRARNVAAVVVTAELPAQVRRGARIDVSLSSLGDASSLLGGTLVMTPLQGPDGAPYAQAQGPVSVAGFSAAGDGEKLSQGVPTAAHISNGAIVQRPWPTRQNRNAPIFLELRNPDFKTAVAIADAINAYGRRRYGRQVASERDLRTVELRVPRSVTAARFLAEIGEIPIQVDVPARVVVDARSGTIVIGRDVTVSKVALTHGNLTLRITESPDVSQPSPFSEGQTVVVPQTYVAAEETGGHLAVIQGPSLETLVQGLNKIGMKPSGIISILQALKTSGALQAELVVQ